MEASPATAAVRAPIESPASGPAQGRVVIVVLNWCGYDVTCACLDSLREADYSPLEILLVDNASPDGSGLRLHQRYPDIPYLQTGENLGYAGGNNRGFEWALERNAEYVLILNNDTVVERDAITKLVAALSESPEAGAISPKILYHDQPEKIWFGGGELSRWRAIGRHRRDGELDSRARLERVERVSFLSGCCLLVRSEVLRSVGHFTEDLFAYVEDVDLSLRMRRAGFDLLYHPNARILHHSRPSRSKPSPSQIFLRDRNRRRVVRRQYGAMDRLFFSLFFYPTRIAYLIAYAARGDAERARAIWRGMTAA